jgi:hypothetical protein
MLERHDLTIEWIDDGTPAAVEHDEDAPSGRMIARIPVANADRGLAWEERRRRDQKVRHRWGGVSS